jgi:hypothetical protein
MSDQAGREELELLLQRALSLADALNLALPGAHISTALDYLANEAAVDSDD